MQTPKTEACYLPRWRYKPDFQKVREFKGKSGRSKVPLPVHIIPKPGGDNSLHDSGDSKGRGGLCWSRTPGAWNFIWVIPQMVAAQGLESSPVALQVPSLAAGPEAGQVGLKLAL